MQLPKPLSWPLVLLAAAALGFLVERLVVTDREAIEALVDDIATAFDRRDRVSLEELLTEDFSHEGDDRARVLDRVLALATRFRPVGSEARLNRLEVDGDEATGTLEVRVRVLGTLAVVAGEVRFRRGDSAWQLSGAGGFPRSLR